MPRRLPDDPIAALEALEREDLRRSSQHLSSSRSNLDEAQNFARALDRSLDFDRASSIDLGLGLGSGRSIDLVRDVDFDLDLDHALDLTLDLAVGLDRGLATALDLGVGGDFGLAVGLDRARALELGLGKGRAQGRAFDRALGSAFDLELALDLARNLERSQVDLDRAYMRLHSARVRNWLVSQARDVNVSPSALWASLLIQRWWQVVVVVWAILADEPDARSSAFSQGEADRARGELEAVDRSWQNIELDPQIELDPGDEEFIHAQLTTIRSQLILDGIPEIIDRALAALHARFADRADHEQIIRAQLADREPPWADDEIDWLIGEYQRASDLVADVSTSDDQAAGEAHNKIKETLGGPIPPPTPRDRRPARAPDSRDAGPASPEGSQSKRIGEAVLTGAGREVGRQTLSKVVDFVAGQSGSPWFRGLWEIVKALGKDWPFPM